MLTKGRLAKEAAIAPATARQILAAGCKAGWLRPLFFVLRDGNDRAFILTETYPGAPSTEALTLGALMQTVRGKKLRTAYAFAYHTALTFHGLTAVTAPGLHLIAIPASTHPPTTDPAAPYEHQPRQPGRITAPSSGRTTPRSILTDDRPVYLTTRPAQQVPTFDLVDYVPDAACPSFTVPVTNPLRTLIDAWMHPDWCGGMDRVADAWRMYWTEVADLPAHRANLSVMLIKTTWPGLWKPLTAWAAATVPELNELPMMVELHAIKLAVNSP